MSRHRRLAVRVLVGFGLFFVGIAAIVRDFQLRHAIPSYQVASSESVRVDLMNPKVSEPSFRDAMDHYTDEELASGRYTPEQGEVVRKLRQAALEAAKP